MTRTLHRGDKIHFDPSLSVTAGADGLFKTPRLHCKVMAVDTLKIEEPAIALNLWSIQGEDGSAFWLVEDKPAGLWFLLRLVGETRHPGGMPAWLEGEEYAVSTSPDSAIPFGYYSPPMLGQLADDELLLRVYVRPVDDTEEFLWVVLRNNVTLEHWVGIVIDPAQILPG